MGTKKTLPSLNTDPEAANFWDTHTFLDYAAKTTEARIRFVKRPKRAIAIRLDQEEIVKVEALAQRKGLSYTTLIRMWIKEHLAG